MRLFGARSGGALAGVHGLDDARVLARGQLASDRWPVYEVRRVFIGPAGAMRSAHTVRSGSRDQMAAWLAPSGQVETDEHGIRRLRGPRSPAGLLVAAPTGGANKKRPCFEQVWSLLTEARPATYARAR